MNTTSQTKLDTELSLIEIEEYRALHNEILTYINAKQNIVHLSLCIIIALIGLQITTDRYLFSLCSVITIYTFFNLDFKYKKGIAECGAYIRAKFENKNSELKWETMLSQLNNKYDNQENENNKNGLIKIKYTSLNKSIYDSGIINYFTSFTLITLLLGWGTLFNELLEKTIKIREFIQIKLFEIIVMTLTTLISVIYLIHFIKIYKHDFNYIRNNYYLEFNENLYKIQ